METSVGTYDIWQCPLYGRCPLLGVSVNGESTVHTLCVLTVYNTGCLNMTYKFTFQ